MLAMLRAAEAMPWPTLTIAMEAERRALFLADKVGPEGAALASAIFGETERLLSAAESGEPITRGRLQEAASAR